MKLSDDVSFTKNCPHSWPNQANIIQIVISPIHRSDFVRVCFMKYAKVCLLTIGNKHLNILALFFIY